MYVYICTARYNISGVNSFIIYFFFYSTKYFRYFISFVYICIFFFYQILQFWFPTTKCKTTIFLDHLAQRAIWAIAITWRLSPSVIRRKLFQKSSPLKLQMYWTNWNQSWSESSLGCLVSKLCPVMPCTNQHGRCY